MIEPNGTFEEDIGNIVGLFGGRTLKEGEEMLEFMKDYKPQAVSDGYAARISSSGMSAARLSIIKDTHILVPRIHGLPKQIFGSIETRLRSSSLVIMFRPECQ